ncbi:MAG: hypothetical protein HRU19_09820 [Pseudobacteriovorax sp.]|nr:hypothetical protein [Pseudobacteriovorax sp.]
MACKAMLEDLRVAIGEYLERHQNLSIQSISNRTHVSYSTIRRIIQNEARDMRDETVLALIQVIMERTRRIAFLNRYYPALGALIAESQRTESESQDYEKIRKYRYKDPHNYILKLAICEAGTSRSTISRILGEIGTLALDEMIEDQFLMEGKEGKVFHHSHSNLLMNAEDILYQIKKDSDYFDKSLVGSEFSRVAHFSASISPKAYRELMTLVNTFVREAESVKESDDGKGNIPIFIDLMMNTYDRATLEGVS